MNKVLVLVPRFGIGGISKIGSFIATTFALKYETLLVSLIDDTISTQLPDNVTTMSLDYSFDNPDIGFIAKKFYMARTVCRLRRIIKINKVGLICSLGLDLGYIVNVSTIGLRCKTITSERGNPSRYSKRYKKKYDKVIRKTDAVVFQTQMAKEAFGNCNISNKAFVIPNPAIGRKNIDYNFNGDLARKREKRIIFCGRLSKEKNVGMLIDAYARLNNPTYKLRIYGDGPEYDYVLKQISDTNLSEKVEIINNCDDVFSKEYNSEIYVLTSNEEGMSNSLIEAMMCGMVCIATDCPPGGCRELLQNGERGILIPTNDAEALCEALNAVISQPALSRELGERAKTIIYTNSVKTIQDMWKNVAKDLIECN